MLWDILKVLTVLVLVLATLFGMLMGFDYVFSQVQCKHYAAMNTAYQFQYDFWAGGCYVYWGNMWIGANKIDIVNAKIQVEP